MPIASAPSHPLTPDSVAARSGSTLPKWQIWTGRVLTALSTVFLLFDAVGKFTMPVQVVQACQKLGLPLHLSPILGVLLTVGTLLYILPKTNVLGAVVLTGYLGGAVAIHLRAGGTLFEVLFPVIFGVLIWGGIYLRDLNLRRVFPHPVNVCIAAEWAYPSAARWLL
jgi:hypothetical protein